MKRIIGVGAGPFNLGLAALASSLSGVEVTLLDERPSFGWHPGMMLPDAQIQVPFLADLVTLADPTNPYSFLAYLKGRGRLHQFYIRQHWYPLRQEYSHYCAWVADQLGCIEHSRRVVGISYDAKSDEFAVCVESGGERITYGATHVVLGDGTRPWLPDALAIGSDRIVHTADYMRRRDHVEASGRVMVVGSGQSAAEIALDVLRNPRAQLQWVTRSARFAPMEVGELTLEFTSPDFIRHFGQLAPPQQEQVNRAQRLFYRGISEYTISDIYRQLYARDVAGLGVPLIRPGTEVMSAYDADSGVVVTCKHRDTGEQTHHEVDFVVAGTGYQYPDHDYLKGVARVLSSHDPADAVADAKHSIDTLGGRIFCQNTREQALGLTTPDLGMGPLRNAEILSAITGEAVFDRERRIAFQTFGATEDATFGEMS